MSVPLPAFNYPPVNSPYPPVNSPYPPNNICYPAQAGSAHFQSHQYPSQGYPTTAEPMQNVVGYEDVTFTPTILRPPACQETQQPETHTEIPSFAGLAEEDVRDAAIQFASKHCCYGKGTVRDMEIKEIEMSSAFHYTLETFGEKREVARSYEPYGGEPLDTALNGIPPGPWEMLQAPPGQFKDFVHEREIPHTAFAVQCHVCKGFGRGRCATCEGFCKVKCTWCSGSGKRFSDDMCSHCNGDGKSKCTKCNGTGETKCGTCQGKGCLKFYLKLTTTWKNHVGDYVCKETGLPDELIHNVTGQVVFEEKHPRVWPVNHFPQQSINKASKNLVEKHKEQYAYERILQQRHKIRIVPVAQVQYSWKDSHGQFYVYGFENEVYFPDYPQSCCWGCNVL